MSIFAYWHGRSPRFELRRNWEHGNALVVSNAPAELRERFQTIGHHDEDAVAELLQTIYQL